MDSNMKRLISGAVQGARTGSAQPMRMMNNVPTPPKPAALPTGQAYVQQPQATFTPAKPPNPVGRPAGGLMAGHALGRARRR